MKSVYSRVTLKPSAGISCYHVKKRSENVYSVSVYSREQGVWCGGFEASVPDKPVLNPPDNIPRVNRDHKEGYFKEIGRALRGHFIYQCPKCEKVELDD